MRLSCCCRSCCAGVELFCTRLIAVASLLTFLRPLLFYIYCALPLPFPPLAPQDKEVVAAQAKLDKGAATWEDAKKHAPVCKASIAPLVKLQSSATRKDIEAFEGQTADFCRKAEDNAYWKFETGACGHCCFGRRAVPRPAAADGGMRVASLTDGRRRLSRGYPLL